MITDSSQKLYSIEEHPSFSGAMDEVKGELRDFISTRLNLLRVEMREKASSFKAGIPLIVAGALLLLVAAVMLNVAILAVIASAFGGGVMAWCWSALILFGLYAIIGGGCSFVGVREIKQTGVIPTHTLNVLKQDQNWIQREAKTQI